jgi:GntR family transcriptional regulator
MIIQVEPQSDIPIYTQLTHQIIKGIAKGMLKPGDTLPSVRAFAADLGVNMHTVNKSYHELEKKGIIQIVPKSGAVILSPQKIMEGDTNHARIKAEWAPLVSEALVIGMEKDQILHLVTDMIHDLSVNE